MYFDQLTPVHYKRQVFIEAEYHGFENGKITATDLRRKINDWIIMPDALLEKWFDKFFTIVTV